MAKGPPRTRTFLWLDITGKDFAAVRGFLQRSDWQSESSTKGSVAAREDTIGGCEQTRAAERRERGEKRGKKQRRKGDASR